MQIFVQCHLIFSVFLHKRISQIFPQILFTYRTTLYILFNQHFTYRIYFYSFLYQAYWVNTYISKLFSSTFCFCNILTNVIYDPFTHAHIQSSVLNLFFTCVLLYNFWTRFVVAVLASTNVVPSMLQKKKVLLDI